jgi:hypothetical protein
MIFHHFVLQGEKESDPDSDTQREDQEGEYFAPKTLTLNEV